MVNLRKISNVMKAVDYLYAGDHGPDSFMNSIRKIEGWHSYLKAVEKVEGE